MADTPSSPLNISPTGEGGGAPDKTLGQRAGEFLGNGATLISNWFRDDETGEFSAKKALLTAGALAALAWAAVHSTWLFVGAMLCMVVGGALLMNSGMSLPNPHAGRSPREQGKGRGREKGPVELDIGIDEPALSEPEPTSKPLSIGLEEAAEAAEPLKGSRPTPTQGPAGAPTNLTPGSQEGVAPVR